MATPSAAALESGGASRGWRAGCGPSYGSGSSNCQESSALGTGSETQTGAAPPPSRDEEAVKEAPQSASLHLQGMGEEWGDRDGGRRTELLQMGWQTPTRPRPCAGRDPRPGR